MKKFIIFCIIIGFIYFAWNSLDSSSTSPEPTPTQTPVVNIVPSVYPPISPTKTPDTTQISTFTPTPTLALTATTPVSSTIPINTSSPLNTLTSTINSTPIIPSTLASSSLASLYRVVENPSTELISREYKWSYGWKEWTWQLQIPQAIYDYYKALPRSPTANYSIYVTHPLDDQYINQLANKLQQIAKQEKYSEFETVSFAAAFVQSLEYTSDLVTEGYDEYPRYPVETLVDQGGDCEDTAILMASIIRAMGYGVVLLVFPETADSSGHCAIGVAGEKGLPGYYWEYNNRYYYYLETTGNNWGIGEAPDKYRHAYAKIYPMVPVPILTHEWNVEANGSYAQIRVTVDNLGSAESQGVYVLVGFDAGNDQVWNRQISPTFDLGVNESETATLNILPPIGKHTRIIVQIICGGYTVDESYSKWFDL